MKFYRLAVLSLVCFAAAAHADTGRQIDWWRLPGAAVVEYADARQGRVCSLFLYNRDTAAVMTWNRNDDREISLYNNNWHFAPGQPVDVAIQIGNTWLDTPGNNTPSALPAAADANHVTVGVAAPVETLLQHADGITAKLGGQDMSLSVAHAQMRQLVHALHRCRAVVQR